MTGRVAADVSGSAGCARTEGTVPRRTSAVGVGAQPGQGDGQEPVEGCLGAQTAGGAQGVQAVDGQLFGRDVVADLATLGRLAHQGRDELAQVRVRLGDVLRAVQGRCEVAASVVVFA